MTSKMTTKELLAMPGSLPGEPDPPQRCPDCDAWDYRECHPDCSSHHRDLFLVPRGRFLIDEMGSDFRLIATGAMPERICWIDPGDDWAHVLDAVEPNAVDSKDDKPTAEIELQRGRFRVTVTFAVRCGGCGIDVTSLQPGTDPAQIGLILAEHQCPPRDRSGLQDEGREVEA